MAVFFALILCLLGVVRAQNLLQILENRESLSEFTTFAKQEPLAVTLLTKYSVTVFAPNNEALALYQGEKSKDIVRYHLSNDDLDSEKLKMNPKIYSQQNTIPLWVNVKHVGKNGYDKEIYINNAKIIRDDERGETVEHFRQLLHVIDRVLWYVRRRGKEGVMNPSAMDLMKGGTTYIIDNLELTKFASLVQNKEKEKLFSNEIPVPSTYFIPVNSDEKNWDKMDSKTIEAHVVPGKVLFTRTIEPDREYETEVLQSNSVHIMLQMSSEELENGTIIWYAKSKTLIGDAQHPEGVVLRRILKTNIPVSNGVVHIIDKPLAVIDQTVSGFLKSEKDIRLKRFHKLIINYASWFSNSLLAQEGITLLAPNNDAFSRIETKYKSLTSDPEELKRVLSFHLVKGEQISHLHPETGQVNSAKCEKDDWCSWAEIATTVDNQNQVYFRLIKSHSGGEVLTVDGGGVNATVTQPDIATTNGIIHIIDRVLGIPSTTVGARLEEDPEVGKTAELGRQNGFNKMLNEANKKYTYFVPNNNAWDLITAEMPSAEKKLFMGDFPNHAKRILERHLLVGESYMIADLYQISKGNNKTIGMMRSFLKLTMKNRDGGIYLDATNDTESQNSSVYQVSSAGITATVVRPDVKCTNGMIHVIDKVIMERKDVTVSVAASLGASILTMLMLLFTAKYL